MERIFKIGHFRVPKTLTFKMRPSSQPFRVGQGLVQYIRVFNFRYTVFLCLKLGIKYTEFFLVLVFYTSFSIVFGMLEGLIQVFWYSTTPSLPPADPDLSCDNEFYLHGNQKSFPHQRLST